MNEFKPMVDWLTYRSYEYNRKMSPDVPYHKWRCLFEDAVIFEEIYERHPINRDERTMEHGMEQTLGDTHS